VQICLVIALCGLDDLSIVFFWIDCVSCFLRLVVLLGFLQVFLSVFFLSESTFELASRVSGMVVDGYCLFPQELKQLFSFS